jgi:23S rRNA (guanosine2251-2'-O)-methyltransferase
MPYTLYPIPVARRECLFESPDFLYTSGVREIIAILHNIRSIHNVASIFRTADGAGVVKLYLAGITPTPTDRLGRYNPKFTKVSLGAERSVPWEKIASPRALAKLIALLQKQKYFICALEQHRRAITCTKRVFRGKRRIALIVGNEVRGIPQSLLEKADAILEIPMYGKKESLNVAVAFGIAAYAARG